MTNGTGQRALPPRLRSRLVEAVFACAVVLVLCTVVLAAGERQASPGAFLAVVGFGVLALLGSVSPRIALACTVLGIFAYYTAGFPPLGMVLPAVAVLYLAASHGRTLWAVGGATILLAVATYFRLVDADPAARFTGYEYVTELALAAAAIALGAAVRLAREQHEQAARIAELVAAEQAHLVRQRDRDARLRIARDLHDTVGHQLTIVSLHAAVAEEAVGRDEDAAREALARVRGANSETLRELRAAVRVLREGDDASDAVSDPAAALGVDDLVATAREAGLRVEANIDLGAGAGAAVRAGAVAGAGAGAAARAGAGAGAIPLAAVGAIPPDVASAASRILTEATTNTLRHASASRLRIDIRAENGNLIAEIEDDGTGCSREALESGHGIAGMRERAALLGGAIRIRSAPGSGCTVRAELPLHPERGHGGGPSSDQGSSGSESAREGIA